MQHHFQVGLGIAQAVNGGDGGNDDGIRAFQQGLGGGQAHLLYVFIDGCVFFDIGITGRDVGLRLVVIVIGNKVFHCIIGKELPHLSVQLRRQGLVRREDQRGTLHFLNKVGNGEGLAGTRYAQQRLLRDAVFGWTDTIVQSLRVDHPKEKNQPVI